jgi:cyd operon protein YbgT
MWYFAWMLGLPLAAAFAILNAMWYELMDDEAKKQASSAADGASSRGKG